MPRFDCHHDRHDPEQYLLDIQSDFHDALSTRLVIPIIPHTRIQNRVRGLHLPIRFQEKEYLIATQYMTVVLRNQLGPKVENLAHFRDDITQSIDFLLQGF